MITYRLLIAIEHALPNWPLVDFRKESMVHFIFMKTKINSDLTNQIADSG